MTGQSRRRAASGALLRREAALLLLLLGGACRRHPRQDPPSDGSPSAPAVPALPALRSDGDAGSPSVDDTPRLPGSGPLEASDSVIELDVPGHPSAVVTLPVGSSGPRPVAFVVHGWREGPQWACPLWRGIVGGGGFVVCPRGVREAGQPRDLSPGSTTYRFASAEALRDEMDADLAALRAHFPGRVDDGPALYAGTSQGAFLGVVLALVDPARFPRLVLTNGGYNRWTPASAREYAAKGGKRVLFACGEASCIERARTNVRVLQDAGVAARAVYAEGAGHIPYGPVADVTREAIGWVLAGDARWTR
jgi:hypothetical protein